MLTVLTFLLSGRPRCVFYSHPKIFSMFNYSRDNDINYGNDTYRALHAHSKASLTIQSDQALQPKNNVADSTIPGATKARSAADAFFLRPKDRPPLPPFPGNKHVLVVRYEDLLHPEHRHHVLRSMVHFSGIGLHRPAWWPEEAANERERLSKLSIEEEEARRMKCAFILADNPTTHRKVDAPKTDVQILAKPSDAYRNEHFVCNAWHNLQNVTDELMRYGYYRGPHARTLYPKCEP